MAQVVEPEAVEALGKDEAQPLAPALVAAPAPDPPRQRLEAEVVNADPQGEADRFYVLFATLQGVPLLGVEEAARLTPLMSRDCACLKTVTDEDLALASAA